MPPRATVIVEAHRSAATLYATGELTTAAVLRAIAMVERLPASIRAICVDLRSVRRTDSHALRMLETFLREWRASRSGTSRVKLAENAKTSLVALRFVHQRWTPALREALGPS